MYYHLSETFILMSEGTFCEVSLNKFVNKGCLIKIISTMLSYTI